MATEHSDPIPRENKRARQVPWLVALTAAGTGLALAFTAPADPDAERAAQAPTAPTATMTAAPAIASAPPVMEAPQIGRLLTASGAHAHAMALAGDSLCWLSTEKIALACARRDNFELTIMARNASSDEFASAMVAAQGGLFWTVDRLDDQPESLRFLPLPSAGTAPGTAKQLAEARSPDHLVADEDGVFWSDLGNLVTLDSAGAARTLSERNMRVVTLCLAPQHIFWIEAPYEGRGRHRLMRIARTGGAAEVVVAALSARERAQLLVTPSHLYWYDDGEVGTAAIVRVPLEGGSPEVIANTGLVSSMLWHASELVWTEVHEIRGATMTLLRKFAGQDPEPVSIGRIPGAVGALTVDEKNYFWSSPRGIESHPRALPATP